MKQNIQKKFENLHESQVKAYKEAGTKALKEWADALALEPMEEGDSKETFVQRCVLSLRKAEPPLWPGVEGPKKFIREEVQKRALATFEKYHPEGSEEGEAEPSEGEGDTEPEQSEEGEAMTEEEDGEEEDGEVEQKAGKPATAPKVKNKVNNRNNQKKKVVRKKGAGAKGGIRKNFAGNRRGKKNVPGNKNAPGNKSG
mmetsp:Transcript_18181/g.45008  ORF Transcript_18181/g.45008 Transcript_18181/m.45008 type:complete len:199 (-) Transcript_18181:1751-2347(-)